MKIVELPCDIGDKVYIINEDCAPCSICQYGNDSKRSPIICFENNRKCPPQQFIVEEKICEAFLIDEEGVSLPGAIDPYEGFLEYIGCDKRVYYSETEANLIAEKYQRKKKREEKYGCPI